MLKWLEENEFAVAGQITPGDVVLLNQKGVKHLMCNRPDGEEFGQPTFDSIKEIAVAQGLPLVNLPVGGEGITMQTVKAFRKVMDEGTRPMVAFCRTGTRCTVLWAMASAIDTAPETLIEKASAQGYEIGHLAGVLETLNELGSFPE